MGNFVVVKDFAKSETFVIGHQYFLDSSLTKAFSKQKVTSEISYSTRSLLEGTHQIPWKYHLPSSPSKSRGLMLVSRTVTLEPGLATRIPSSYEFRSAKAPPCREGLAWGYFSNICPDGCLLTFIEVYGHLTSKGKIARWMTNEGPSPINLHAGHPVALFDEENSDLYGTLPLEAKSLDLAQTTVVHNTQQRTESFNIDKIGRSNPKTRPKAHLDNPHLDDPERKGLPGINEVATSEVCGVYANSRSADTLHLLPKCKVFQDRNAKDVLHDKGYSGEYSESAMNTIKITDGSNLLDPSELFDDEVYGKDQLIREARTYSCHSRALSNSLVGNPVEDPKMDIPSPTLQLSDFILNWPVNPSPCLLTTSLNISRMASLTLPFCLHI